jgi:molybdenum cofactor guanylyltransferase
MSNANRPAGVLLAGGLARRMGGGDKPLLRLYGRTMLDHAIARIAPQVCGLVLNANGDRDRFAQWNLPVIEDPLPGYPGPLAGVLAGMRWAHANHPETGELLSVPTDTPFLPRDLVQRLQEGRKSRRLPIACAASGGRTHPVAALWPVSLAAELEAALLAGTRKIDAWTARFGVAEVAFDDDGYAPFFNVNRPDELAIAEQMAANSGLTC